jgi:hypothetical protein
VLLFNARLIGLSIAGLAVSGIALAQEGKNVTTGAETAKLGGEFRSELIYSDNGLMKKKGSDPEATTGIGVSAVNIKLDGKVNPATDYSFRFNLLGTGVLGPVEIAYGKHWFTNSIGFSIGRQTVLQGGFDNIDGGYKSHATGIYADNMSFNPNEDMIALHLKVAGEITLQIVNDRYVDGPGRMGAANWNTGRHQTFVAGWRGNFGTVTPMLNIGSYDNNKSRWMDLGIKTSMAGLDASLDIYQNTFTNKVTVGKKNEEPQDVATSITLNLAYNIAKTATPFLYFSTYDAKQADDSKLGLKDRKTNSYATDADGNLTGGMNWDDNGVVWAIGTDLHMMGNGWSPFFALVNRSGKWEDSAGKEETKSEMMIKLGAHAEI